MSTPTDQPGADTSSSPQDAASPADRELRDLLRQFRAPPPPPRLFERAVTHALRERDRERRHARSRLRWLVGGFGAAVAAGLVLLSVGGLIGQANLPGTPAGAEAIPTVSMSLHQPETIRLVFAAESALDEATMTVLLPDGIELEGFPGEREIRWDTSLAEGRNLLPLTLVATADAGGELVARLEHASRDRTFRLRIEIG